MDKLTDAIAQLLATGSNLAPKALYGYFVVRVFESLADVAICVTIVLPAYKLFRTMVTRAWDYYDRELQEGKKPTREY